MRRGWVATENMIWSERPTQTEKGPVFPHVLLFFLYILPVCRLGRYVKHVARRFKNGFREGGVAPARKKKAAEK